MPSSGSSATPIVIYADFSGYTDIAIGVAKLLGFQFPRNFDRPYAARSIQDFWRRWHMTLSRWLRDYLYIPLGGNRRGERRTYVNVIITMILGGLWHGAAWTFVIWGAYHGGLLAAHQWRGGTATVEPVGRPARRPSPARGDVRARLRGLGLLPRGFDRHRLLPARPSRHRVDDADRVRDAARRPRHRRDALAAVLASRPRSVAAGRTALDSSPSPLGIVFAVTLLVIVILGPPAWPPSSTSSSDRQERMSRAASGRRATRTQAPAKAAYGAAADAGRPRARRDPRDPSRVDGAVRTDDEASGRGVPARHPTLGVARRPQAHRRRERLDRDERARGHDRARRGERSGQARWRVRPAARGHPGRPGRRRGRSRTRGDGDGDGRDRRGGFHPSPVNQPEAPRRGRRGLARGRSRLLRRTRLPSAARQGFAARAGSPPASRGPTTSTGLSRCAGSSTASTPTS